MSQSRARRCQRRGDLTRKQAPAPAQSQKLQQQLASSSVQKRAQTDNVTVAAAPAGHRVAGEAGPQEAFFLLKKKYKKTLKKWSDSVTDRQSLRAEVPLSR